MINIENKEFIYKEVTRHLRLYGEYGNAIKSDIESFMLYLRKIKNEYRNIVDSRTYHGDVKIKCGKDYWILAVQYKISDNKIKFTRVSFYKK